MLTRRVFLRGSSIAMAGMGAVPGWLARAAAAEGKKRKTLVAIFQRGAADGLNIVIPFGDKRYRELRPTLAIAEPNRQGSPNGPFGPSIDLDGTFALNGALQPLKALWDRQQLAIVEATGSPDPTRSHFDAQGFMESGTPGVNRGDGWLNRALPPEIDASPLRAVALGNQVPLTLRGEKEAIAVSNAQQFNMGNQDAVSILQSMYTNSPDPQLGRAGKDAFEAMKILKSIQGSKQPAPAVFNAGRSPAAARVGAFAYGPGNALIPQYPQGGELGRSLQQLAGLIKAESGIEAAFAEIGGWDHHGNENPQLANVLREFSTAIAAFCNDMGDRMEDIVLVTMSEFGRTAAENGDAGTDHGHGSLMMVLGGAVRGGKVYGKWPGLEKEQLYEGRDLAVTTDFRAVLGELVVNHLGQKDLGAVFPGFRMGDSLGLLRV
jgi:uncharacterized protein (DUF1501 family)